jgi:ribosome-associated protein
VLVINEKVKISLNEVEMSAVRSQGAGGQNVNKVASAIHLRFDIGASSLPDAYKERLLNLNDQRITKDGIVIIKAQSHRTQDQNRDEALERLQQLIYSITTLPKPRRPTKPTRSSQRKRLDSKTKRSAVKALRKPIDE